MLRKILASGLVAGLFVSAAWADVSGNWNFAVEIAGVGGGNASVTMVQGADGAITGSYAGQLGNTAINGKAEGNSFEFTVDGQMGAVKYMGEQQEDGTLSGKLDLGGMGEGTFKATRKE